MGTLKSKAYTFLSERKVETKLKTMKKISGNIFAAAKKKFSYLFLYRFNSDSKLFRKIQRRKQEIETALNELTF